MQLIGLQRYSCTKESPKGLLRVSLAWSALVNTAIGAVWRKADQRFFVNHFGSGYAIHFKSFSLTAPTGAI